MRDAPAGANGRLLYDGSCGFCARWVPFWAPTLARIGIATLPLQDPWVRERVTIPEAELLTDLFLVRDDGSFFRGPEAYRYAMRRIWWTWPLWLLSTAPGLRQLFDWAYAAFARNRYHVSQVCGLGARGIGE